MNILRLCHKHTVKLFNNRLFSVSEKYRPFLNDLFVCRLNLDLMDYPELNSQNEVDKINRIHKSCKDMMQDSINEPLQKKKTMDLILKNLMANDCNNMQRCKILEVFGEEFMSPNIAIVHQTTMIKILLAFGNEENRPRYLPRLLDGELSSLVLLPEHAINSLTSQPSVTARLADDGIHYILNGLKSNALYINQPHLMLVFASIIDDSKHADSMVAFLIESDSPGVSMKIHPQQYSNTSQMRECDVQLENVVVSKKNILGFPESGGEILRTAKISQSLTLSSICCGMQKSILAQCLKFANERILFGVPLCTYDNVKTQLISICVDAFMSESMVYFINGMMDLDPARDWLTESIATKIFCIEAVARSCDKLVRLHSHNGLKSGSQQNIDGISQCLLHHEVSARHDREMIAHQCLVHFRNNRMRSNLFTELGYRMGLRPDVLCFENNNSDSTNVNKHLHPSVTVLLQHMFAHLRKSALNLHKAYQILGDEFVTNGIIQGTVSSHMVDWWPFVAAASRVSRAACLDLAHNNHQKNLLRTYFMDMHFNLNQSLAESDIPPGKATDLLSLAGTRSTPLSRLAHPMSI